MDVLSFGGRPVEGFGLGIGQPGDWYYTRWVYPDDVREAKRRVDAKFTSVHTDIQTCTALSSAEKSAFEDLYVSWRKLYCRSEDTSCKDPDVSIWGLGGQMDDVERYDKFLYDWQVKVQGQCALSAPVEKPDIVKREESSQRSELLGTVKTVAVTAVIVAGIVYFIPIIGRLVPSSK